MGAEVLDSLTPGQQVVKIVHEELTSLMGTSGAKLSFANKPPTVILLAGLQGSGKTTAAGKLARLLAKQKKTPALVAADVYRPAAIQQLQTLGKSLQVPVFERGTADPVETAAWGIEQAKAQGRDVVIVDTAGRLSDRPGDDGRARADQAEGQAARRGAGARLDDRPGRGRHGGGVPRGGRLRRRDPDQARRRRPRRRRAGGARGHREADPLHVGRREARPARGVPPRADGFADPRHGRRHVADRARPGGVRREPGRRDGGQAAARPSSRSRTSSTSCGWCAR